MLELKGLFSKGDRLAAEYLTAVFNFLNFEVPFAF